MNSFLRIDRIYHGLLAEYHETSLTANSKPFKKLLSQIEIDISKHKEETA